MKECTHSYARNVPKLLLDLGIFQFLPSKKLVSKLPLNQGPATALQELMGHPAVLKNSFL